MLVPQIISEEVQNSIPRKTQQLLQSEISLLSVSSLASVAVVAEGAAVALEGDAMRESGSHLWEAEVGVPAPMTQ